VTADQEGVSIDREELRRCHPAVASRVVRRLLRGFGILPGRAGTRLVLQFITHAPSGRWLRFGESVWIRTEFDHARIERRSASPPDLPLEIDAGVAWGTFCGPLALGGRHYQVAAVPASGVEPPSPGRGWRVRLPADPAFPLLLRGRQPGDRVHTPAGTKSLKKLMIERRIPLGERSRLPVLVDATGRILWVAGIEPAPPGTDDPRGTALDVVVADGG
jgi:tRNA(Ile)-lysidine synthase